MKHLLFFFFLLVTQLSFAQKANFVFRGTISNSDSQSKEGGVKVFIEQDGSTIESTVTSSNGKYSLKANVDFSQPFFVVFSKSGLVSKRISIDYSKLNIEDAPAGDLSPTDKLDVSLFENRDNVDFSFLNSEPVGKFSWDASKMSPTIDRGQMNAMSTKIDKLLKEADEQGEENQKKYDALIKEADQLFASKSYEDALLKYEASLQYKPQEQHPNQRIVEIDAILAAKEEQALLEKQQNEVYYKLVEEGDALRDQGKLEDAVVRYEQAKEEKETQYVKDQIADLLDKIDEIKKEKVNKEKYDEAIKKGLAFLEQKSYRAAKDQFEDAARRMPNEQLPKDKLAEIEAELNKAEAEEEKRKQYDAMVLEADGLYDAENYEEAKTKYEEALAIEDASSYLRERVKLCEAKIAELQAEKEKNEKIALLLEEGQQQFDLSAWSDAQVKYEEVLVLDAENQKAKDQLELIKIKIEELENEEAREAAFIELVKEGDDFVGLENFENALLKYKEAEVIKTTPELDEKIAKVETEIEKLKTLADQKEAYEQLISAANGLYENAQWIDAKTKYQEALAIDESQTLPQDRIAEIDKILADNQAEQEQNEKYNNLITEADQLFSNAKWEEAKSKYEESLTVLENEHPKNRINEIVTMLENIAKENAKKEEFDAFVQSAETKYANGQLEDAKSDYKKALDINSSDSAIQEKINQIDAELAGQMAENEKKEKYEAVILQADELFNNQNWSGAKALYEEAKSIDDTQEYPKTRIAEIEKKLAEELAKNSEAEQYAMRIKEADDLVSKEDYLGAIAKYTEAIKLDGTQTYPSEQIDMLQSKIEKKEELDRNYADLLDEGKALMAEKKYTKAVQQFNEALSLKPNEKEPVELAEKASMLAKESSSDANKQFEKILTVAKTKMEDGDLDKANELVDRALSLASTLGQDDQPAIDLKEEIEEKIKLKNDFDKLVQTGDKAKEDKQYAIAIDNYEKALLIESNSITVKDKIDQVKALIASEETSAQNEKVYAEYMSKGAGEFAERDYFAALESFKSALSTKPGDQAAQNKVDELSQLIQELKNAENAERDLENKINGLISTADAQYNQELYTKAIVSYESALKLDMDNAYVKLRIVECQKLLKKSEIEAEEKAYKDLLLAADKYYEIESYDKAIETYKEALKIRPSDAYPQEKLDEIDAILNPPFIASADLEDLGERMDNSIMDGGFILAQADKEREAVKKSSVENLVEDINNKATELTKKKSEQHSDNVNEIYEVMRSADLDYTGAEMDLANTIDVLKKSENELRAAEMGASTENYASNQSGQDVLYIINEKSALDYQEKEGVQFENSQFMKKIVQSENVKAKEMSNANYDENLASTERLTIVKIKIEEGTKVDAEKPKENNDELVNISNLTQQAEAEKFDDSQKHAYKTDDQLIDVKARIISTEEGMDDNREEMADHLHVKDKEFAKDKVEQSKKEEDQAHVNKQIVDETLDKVYTVDKEAVKAGEDKQDYVNKQKEKSQADVTEDENSDENERHNAAKKINNIYIDVENTKKEGLAKSEDNSEEVKGINKAHAQEESSAYKLNEDKQHKNLESIKAVDAGPKEKVKAANSLGEEYPEGVSQEVFSRKDSDGIIVAVITRRIVVRNGHADVYVKTQSSHAVTYQKNGKPSLEHVWQNETQGPELERHF